MHTGKNVKWALAMVCALAVASCPAYGRAAEEGAEQGVASERAASAGGLATHTLAGITVEGEQDKLPGGMLNATANVGLLGQMDVMDTPFTVTNISQEVIETFTSPYYGISDALAVSPSVRMDRGGTYTDISIRGIYQSGHSMYVNGVPGLLAQYKIPYYWIQDVTIISGPNIGVNGTGYSEAIGGSVNMHSKVASEEGNAEVKLTYRGGSSFEEGFDYGTRFGEDNEFGVRVVGNNINGETSIDGENLEQQSFMVNLDHQGERSKTNLLVGYIHTDHEGGPGSITFDSAVTEMPGAPDPSKLYKPDWAVNEYDNWIAALNHEQKVSDHLSVFLNAGYHREDWYGYMDGNPRVINNAGDFTISLSNYPIAFTKKYLSIGVKGDFNIGSVKNEYIVGVDKTWYTYDGGTNPNWSWSGTGNLYQSNSWTNPGDLTPFTMPHNQDAQMVGWHVVDTLKALDDRLQFTVGVHGHRVKRTPAGDTEQKSDAVSPTFAVSYKITPDFMVYADHTESFGIGSRVSTTDGYANGGAMLDPTKTKQNEIGVKLKAGKFFHTLTYFHIEQANTVDVWENGLKYLRIDGEQTNQGFEWGFTGEIGRKWDLLGGMMYLDSKDDDGDRVNGAARWSASLGAIYHPNDRWSLIGRAIYLGTSTINDGALSVPSFIRYDLGASFKTKISQTPVTFTAMCYNVADENYWQARSGYSTVTLGAPRTFVLSASFEL